MFGRNRTSDSAADSQDPRSTDSEAVTGTEDTALPANPAEAKKNRPTPKRSEQQARNQRPLVGGDRKAADRKAREEMRRRRDEARIGVMNGDERYLGPRDAGEQRRYVRDYVDARFSIGELFIPIALVVLLAGMFMPDFAMIANFVVYGLIALIVLDSVLLCTLLRGRIRAKFGADSIQKGTNFYAIMRAIQIRRLRVPKPAVRRRQFPS
ncbi:DUF3043 domain-containing protein [Brevibacterium sp.]|uniref:DUF3043 domain-containing protein n=1 Tax=Brevibacterium sp. TaxID=1701 RepID=UPI0025B8B9AE|nr:DUF3043 domain-containing protein [Brevibacterium sp.]